MKCFTLYLRNEKLSERNEDAAASLIKLFIKHRCKDEFFFFENLDRDMLIITLVFNSTNDAEEIAKHFSEVPDWLDNLGFKAGLFLGKPYCIAWLDAENIKRDE